LNKNKDELGKGKHPATIQAIQERMEKSKAQLGCVGYFRIRLYNLSARSLVEGPLF
jgi:hypothetical protein